MFVENEENRILKFHKLSFQEFFSEDFFTINKFLKELNIKLIELAKFCRGLRLIIIPDLKQMILSQMNLNLVKYTTPVNLLANQNLWKKIKTKFLIIK